MAGEWIKWTKGLARKREVLALASLLGKDRLLVAGALMELWEWADENTEDGHVQSVTIVTLQSLESVPGLVTALCRPEIGWLIPDADGNGVLIPNYARHNGKSAKKRLSDSDRQNRSRANRDKCHAPTVTKSVTRVEESREEKEEYPQTPKGAGGQKPKKETPPVPAELNTPEFIAAWERWQSHRRELKKPLTPTSIGQQFKKFVAMGAGQAIAMIDRSIEKGWQGLFDPPSPPVNHATNDDFEISTPGFKPRAMS